MLRGGPGRRGSRRRGIIQLSRSFAALLAGADIGDRNWWQRKMLARA
jgi:hypothetical protein